LTEGPTIFRTEPPTLARNPAIPRQYYLDLAARGLRMPVGAHLVLHDHPEPEAILLDGERLGRVVEESARRYGTPLAVPLMDLMIEKTALLEMLGVPPEQIPTHHLSSACTDDWAAMLEARMPGHRNARAAATADAVRYIAERTDLLPIGMAIGPFSLMVKLVANPISAVFLAGRGRTAADSGEVALVERVLEAGVRVIEWSLKAQLAAGARAVFICEPAASAAYLSPRQLAAGADILDRYVLHYNRRIRALLAEAGADLIFHCCGEITPDFVRRFVELDPAILSLGSSVRLWEIARFVPKTTVLFGNLPSRKFFSDTEITEEQVRQQARHLVRQMRQVGHPFILGSECDVLSVTGKHELIKRKVQAMLDAAGEA